MSVYKPGIAPIKAQFLRTAWPARSEALDGTTETGADSEPTAFVPDDEPDGKPEQENPTDAAAPTTSSGADRAQDGEQDKPRKRARGQNKGRTFTRTEDNIALCTQIATGRDACKFGDSCKFTHDLCTYLEQKPRDIETPPHPVSSHECVRFVPADERDVYLATLYEHAVMQDTKRMKKNADVAADAHPASGSTTPSAPTAPTTHDTVQASVVLGTTCPYFQERGTCPMGWKCRFLGAHVRRLSASCRVLGAEAQGMLGTGLELVEDEAKKHAWLHRSPYMRNEAQPESDQVNWLASDVARRLRSRKYTFDKAPAITSALRKEVDMLSAMTPAEAASTEVGKGPLRVNYEHERLVADPSATLEACEDALRNDGNDDAAADTARVRPCEKRRLQWKGDLYLAPLTTTGNLPFRRLCASFGSDIHCGEMGMAESFLQGHASEWSLVRRWEGERIFGTQVCGAKPELLVPTAEVLAREVGRGLDFVDVNCGCPIDLVYNKGAGSALLDHANKLGRIVRGMSEALGEIPLTIKLRTGTTSKPTTHKIFARAQTEWGVGGLSLHGRSRKQRYKNDADWGYIRTCVDTLHDAVRTWNEEPQHADEPDMVPVPVYGNGDVYGWRDYYDHLEHAHVDGTMIARGALIKPWIFTEIKERRDWDISSRERLDMIRQYASYGLTHWGSDTQGVNTTRRFLCEMLSFTHRYVPLGLLDHIPVRMNDRPPPFHGRDPLESLLSSPSAHDWVRISDMFLGPAPPDWHFTPKHRSNAYEQQG